eukprot:gene13526-13645_t
MDRRALIIGTCITAAGVATAQADEPKVYLDYTQKQLDDAYTQLVYAPNTLQLQARYAANSAQTRARLGAPKVIAYGEKPIERILLYPSSRPNAPLFVFLHGGAWRAQKAENYLYPAEMFLDQGISYAAVDFDGVEGTDGRLEPTLDQLRRAARHLRDNAAALGCDPERITLGAHSSGAHWGGLLVTTDWQQQKQPFRNALLISGLYDLRGPRLSVRSSYVKFDDAMEDAFSAQRHIDRLATPLILMTGTLETPEFQRQSRDFTAAVKAAGKPVELRIGEQHNHFEMCDTLGNPYAIAGRAALELRGASPARPPAGAEPLHLDLLKVSAEGGQTRRVLKHIVSPPFG